MPPPQHGYALHFLSALIAVCLPHAVVAQDVEPPLFDGKTLDGWTTLDGEPVTRGWEVVDGMIHLKRSNPRAGHIVTEREYGDFDLSFEWKIAPSGNSGLKYRVRDYGDGFRGCEYQILDDARYRSRLHPRGSAGALYDLFEPNKEKQLQPAGQFNSARIVMRDNHVEHWLNGRRIVAAEIGSSEWNQRIAESKFSDLEDFAQNRRGKIMLTDHGSEVWYRNFQFRPLNVAGTLRVP